MTDHSPSHATASLIEHLLHAGETWRNWRAMLALCVTAALAVVVLGIGSAGAARGNILLTLFASLVAIGVLLTGISTAGVLLMDQAAGAPPRHLRAALTDGVVCALRFVLLGVGAVMLAVLYAIVAGLLLWLCRIPGLGPVLYTVLFPLLALVSAFGLTACYLLCLFAGPALWSGASLRQTLARLHALLTGKPVQAVVAGLLLALLVFVLGAVLFGAASSGVFFVAGLSAAVLDVGAGFGAVWPQGTRMGGGHAIAGMIGAGLVYALVGAAVCAVTIFGGCRIYLHLTAGIDFDEAEAAFADSLRRTRKTVARFKDAAGRHAREAREEVRRRTQAGHAATPAQHAGHAQGDDTTAGTTIDATTPPPATTAAVACPSCGAAAAPDDAFCGNCGHRLQAES